MPETLNVKLHIKGINLQFHFRSKLSKTVYILFPLCAATFFGDIWIYNVCMHLKSFNLELWGKIAY